MCSAARAPQPAAAAAVNSPAAESTLSSMFDAAIEAGIATFLAHRGAADAEVRAGLERMGVEEWLAQRLVLFLPLALGRRVLGGATMTDQLDDGGVLRPLEDEPVFIEARARAENASREEVEVIGLRSSEVHAANRALNAGSKIEDLVYSPVTLTSPLIPTSPGDGGVPSPRAIFIEFLAAHGYAVAPPLSVDARVFARVNPTSVTVQIDFAVSHPALAVPRLLESFGSIATTWRDAIGQNVGKFERSSLHPLIAGLLDRSSCADQVTWERLEHPSGAFDLCIGGQLVLYASEPVPDIAPLLDAIKSALAGVPLSRAVHALRMYVCWSEGKMVANEVLVDNEPWAAGAELVAAHAWPRADGLWGSRLFFLAVPAPD